MLNLKTQKGNHMMDKDYVVTHLVGAVATIIVAGVNLSNVLQTSVNALAWSLVALGVKVLHNWYLKNRNQSKSNK